jgi:hypothetical protein
MSYKPDESTLAAYLYGELSKDEMARVSSYLTAHPEVKKELEEIKSLQKTMGKLNDKEVTEPSFVFENPSVVVVSDQPRLNSLMKLTMGMAASIAILLLIGYFTSLNISFKDNGMQLSFGTIEHINTPVTNNITEANVKAWMKESLATNNEDLLSKIDAVESNFSNQVDLQQVAHHKQLKSLTSANRVDQDIINQYVSQLKQENKDIILSLVEVSERNQQQYMSEMITDFSAYLDEQRSNDLEMIQTSFNNLKDNTEISQIETNEVLASIISTVNGTETQF